MTLKTYLYENISLLHILFDYYIRPDIGNLTIKAIENAQQLLSNNDYSQYNISKDEIKEFFSKMIDNYNLLDIKDIQTENIYATIEQIFSLYNKNKELYFPYNWTGHAIAFIIEKNDINNNLIIVNTGEGSHRHRYDNIFTEMMKITNITDKLLKDFLFEIIIYLKYINYDDNKDNLFYEISINKLLQNGATFAEQDPSLYFISQKSGSCSFKGPYLSFLLWSQKNKQMTIERRNQLDLEIVLDSGILFTKQFKDFEPTINDDVNLVIMTMVTIKNKFDMASNLKFDILKSHQDKFDNIITICENTLKKYYDYTECPYNKGNLHLICDIPKLFEEQKIKLDTTNLNIVYDVFNDIKKNEIQHSSDDYNNKYNLLIYEYFNDIHLLLKEENINLNEIMQKLLLIICRIFTHLQTVSDDIQPIIRKNFIEKINDIIYKIKCKDYKLYNITNLKEVIVIIYYLIGLNYPKFQYDNLEHYNLTFFNIMKYIYFFLLCDILITQQILTNDNTNMSNINIIKNIDSILVFGYEKKIKKYVLDNINKYASYMFNTENIIENITRIINLFTQKDISHFNYGVDGEIEPTKLFYIFENNITKYNITTEIDKQILYYFGGYDKKESINDLEYINNIEDFKISNQIKFTKKLYYDNTNHLITHNYYYLTFYFKYDFDITEKKYNKINKKKR